MYGFKRDEDEDEDESERERVGSPLLSGWVLGEVSLSWAGGDRLIGFARKWREERHKMRMTIWKYGVFGFTVEVQWSVVSGQSVVQLMVQSKLVKEAVF